MIKINVRVVSFQIILLFLTGSNMLGLEPICDNEVPVIVTPVYILAENLESYELIPELPVDTKELHEGRLLICSGGYIFQLKVVPEIEFYSDFLHWTDESLVGTELISDNKLLLLQGGAICVIYSPSGFKDEHSIFPNKVNCKKSNLQANHSRERANDAGHKEK